MNSSVFGSDEMPAIWDLPDFDSHEAVHVFDDRATGLKAVIAVHLFGQAAPMAELTALAASTRWPL